MKIKGNIFGKTFRTLALVFALTLCSNLSVNASNSNVSIPSSVEMPALYGSRGGFFSNLGRLLNSFFNGQTPGGSQHQHNGHRNGSGCNPKVPLDGGLSFLLIGGAAYGVTRLRKKQ